MDSPVESMLLDISIFSWMAIMEIQDEDVPEVEKKLVEEAVGLTLRGLLRGLLWQSPISEHFIFILKHFDPYGRLFSPVLNQLLYYGNHHPRIDLDEVQQAFPEVPRKIWNAAKTYAYINEGDLEVEEL